jgi:hypothetical protein
MTQHDLVLSLHEQGLRPVEIWTKFAKLFRLLAAIYSPITRTIRMLSWTAHEVQPLDWGGTPPNPDHDARILAVLAADPITRVCVIAREI